MMDASMHWDQQLSHRGWLMAMHALKVPYSMTSVSSRRAASPEGAPSPESKISRKAAI